MMKRVVMLISMLFCVLCAGAQSNIVSEIENCSLGEGRVRINQPEKLVSLMGSMAGEVQQVEGYRVLVYSGNNSRQARDEANAMAEYMRANYPGAEVYVVFESPIRTCLYGDYRTREEAEAAVIAKNPVFFELIPLTLEEIFICEMEEKGYDFNSIIG